MSSSPARQAGAVASLTLAALAALSATFLLDSGGDLARAADGRDGKSREANADDDPLVLLVDLMLEVDDDDVRRDVLQGMTTALRGRRNLGVPKGWETLYPQLTRSDDETVRELAVLLAITFRDQAAMRSLLTTVRDSSAGVADRTRAISALAAAGDPALGSTLLEIVAAEDVPAPVLSASIRSLADHDDARVLPLLLKRYAALGAARRDAIATLASRPKWALALLDAVAEKRIPRADVSAFDARQMASLGNEAVAARLAEVWGNVRPTNKDRERLLKQYRNELTAESLAEADVAAGRAVFAKTCAGCHRLFDAGRHVGPELTGSQRANVDYVLQNLVDPNAIIGRDFQVTTIITTGGRVLNGIVAEETDNLLVLKTANEDVSLSKGDVEERKASRISMMPEGMLEKMTPAERRNLAAYLGSPRQVPLPKGSDESLNSPAAGQ